jgi:hypothetical protein
MAGHYVINDGLRVGVPLALAVLELLHPPEVTADAWWGVLHVLLIAGYALLVWSLWPLAVGARVVVCVFATVNTAFLVVDGLLSQTGPPVDVLANVTGAAWCAALLAVAAARSSSPPPLRGALAIVWLTFVASSVLPVVGVASRAIALATGVSAVYLRGFGALPFALMVVAAVTRQHVSAEAAFGMLCLGLAAGAELVTGRSVPAASSRPESG